MKIVQSFGKAIWGFGSLILLLINLYISLYPENARKIAGDKFMNWYLNLPGVVIGAIFALVFMSFVVFEFYQAGIFGKRKSTEMLSPKSDIKIELINGSMVTNKINAPVNNSYDNHSKVVDFSGSTFKDSEVKVTVENKKKDEVELVKPDVLIEAPFSYRGPVVYSFMVRNKGSEKLTNCYAKLDVIEVNINNIGVTIQPHPSNWYPEKILWKTKSVNGDVELRPNDPKYLDVIELGQEHFRFLFDGNTPLANGMSEPQNLNKAQKEWLSHNHYILEITLYGDDKNGKPIEVKKEFALNFRVSGMQNIKFPADDPLGNPYFENNIPESACVMSIKEITSKENMRLYFEW